MAEKLALECGLPIKKKEGLSGTDFVILSWQPVRKFSGNGR